MLGIGIGMSSTGTPSLPSVVSSILRKYGSDAHLFVPGVGYMNGFAAGNYLESTGNTNASVDGAVGLVLDAAGSVGPELVVAASSWGLLGDGGTNIVVNTGTSSVTFNGSEAAFSGFSFTSSVAVGKTYKATFTISSRVAGQVQLQCGGFSSPFVNANGSYSYIFNTSGTLNATIKTDSNIFNGVVSGLSIREVTGTHATQTTTANKPILRRGIVNLLTYSNAFSDASWGRNGVSISPGVSDPFGGSSATTLTATSGVCELLKGVSGLVSGANYTEAIWIRRRTGTGAVSIVRGDGGAWVSVGVTTEWQLFTNSYASTGSSGSGVKFGSIGDAVDIYNAGVFQGALTAQQILAAGGIPLTTTAPASSSAGAYAWQFDGSNDVLALPGPLFQMADDHCVVTAVSLNATSGVLQDIFSQRGATATPIVCEIVIPATTTRPVATWRDDAGTLLQLDSGTAIGLNTPTVISAQKVGNTETIEINGVQKASSNTVFGVASVTAAALGNYSGASTNQPLNGFLYPTIAIKGTVAPAEKKLLTKFLGSIAGVSIA